MAAEVLTLLLMTIRDHPFIDAHQLARFLAIPISHLYPSLLDGMERGFLQALRVPSLSEWTERDLYALSDRGVHELAYCEGIPIDSYQCVYPEVSRASYRRTLLTIPSLYGVRQLLALWATQWELASWATPRSASFTYQGRVFWMRLHGWGWVHCPHLASRGGWFPVCMEWDEGEVRLEGLRRRFGAFYRWRESEEAHASPRGFPVLVMVTPTRKRALQTLHYLRESSARWQARLLDCYATSRREAFRPDGEWYRLGAESAPGPLLAGLDGLSQPLFALGGQGVVRSKGEREREDTGSPPRSVKAVAQPGRQVRKTFLGPSLSALISQGARKRTRAEEILRARLTLSELGLRTLKAVGKWPLLNSSELAILLEATPSHECDPEDVRRVLGQLGGMGLVRQHAVKGVPYWYLSGLGIELLAAESPLPARRYARFRGWWVSPGGQPLRLRIGGYMHAWEHTRRVISFILSLVLLARKKQSANLDHELVSWDATPGIYWDYGAGKGCLFPDTVGTYRVGDQVYTFFLEVDRGKGHREKLLEKFVNYAQYGSCGAYRLTFGRFPYIVIVTEDEGRARINRHEVENACQTLGAPLLPAYITTTLLLDEKGVEGPIWRKVGRWKMQYLFPAFADEPLSAIRSLVVGHR